MRFLSPFLRSKRQSKSTAPPVWEPTPSPAQPLIFFDEDNRRHRADAPYLLPKDLQEVNRLDYQHYIFRRILQGNCFAPVHNFLQRGGNVLDVGCGTGRWGYEIAKTYPRTQVVGFDLEAVPPTTSVPLNYKFYQGNLLHGVPFAGQPFHYVHQRLLVAGIPVDKWPAVIEELRSITAPGGWIELVEMGTTFHRAGPATLQFLEWWKLVSADRGIDASKVASLVPLLIEMGLPKETIRAKTITTPVGTWGGTLGTMLAQDILAGWPTMRPLIHEALGIAPERFDAVLEQLSWEWNAYHTSYDVYFYCVKV
jgi:SAM-dependent methyltransferase